MKQYVCASRRLLPLALAFLALSSAPALAQDSLDTLPAGHVTEIDILEGSLSDHVAITVSFVNGDGGDDGRLLTLTNQMPFPVEIVGIYDESGLGAGTWYELVAGPGVIDSDASVGLARNIYPNPLGSCDGIDEPPCTYELTISLDLDLGDGGVLAPEGQYTLTFDLKANENPITIDFTEFFESLEGELP